MLVNIFTLIFRVVQFTVKIMDTVNIQNFCSVHINLNIILSLLLTVYLLLCIEQYSKYQKLNEDLH